MRRTRQAAVLVYPIDSIVGTEQGQLSPIMRFLQLRYYVVYSCFEDPHRHRDVPVHSVWIVFLIAVTVRRNMPACSTAPLLIIHYMVQIPFLVTIDTIARTFVIRIMDFHIHLQSNPILSTDIVIAVTQRWNSINDCCRFYSFTNFSNSGSHLIIIFIILGEPMTCEKSIAYLIMTAVIFIDAMYIIRRLVRCWCPLPSKPFPWCHP